jgi:hypothetical protein
MLVPAGYMHREATTQIPVTTSTDATGAGTASNTGSNQPGERQDDRDSLARSQEP